MRICSWNVNSIRSRKDHVQQWLRLRKLPEIVCFQETKVQDSDFPLSLFEELGYNVEFYGQKAYNGVCIASPYNITDVIKGTGNKQVDEQARVITATIEGIRVINTYIPNGSSPDSDKYVYKFEFLKAFESFVKEQIKKYSDVVVVGDFNIAPQDIDVWDASRFEGHIMFTDAEKGWLKKIIDLGLRDVFREIHPNTIVYSWYDYITKAFDYGRGWRIDFIFATQGIYFNACVIDQEPRAWDKPSDHCPVVGKISK